MRKFLFFALALVAGALAFTSCDNGNSVDSPLVGTWYYQPAEDLYDKITFYYEITFDGKGNYVAVVDYYFYDDAGKLIPTPHEHVVIKGSYTIKDDVATVHQTSQTISIDGRKAEEIEWEPVDEQMKFKVEGKTLTLTRDYGTDDAWDMILTKK